MVNDSSNALSLVFGASSSSIRMIVRNGVRYWSANDMAKACGSKRELEIR